MTGVEVVWIDATGRAGWESRDEAKKMKPVEVLTVGYEISDDKSDYLVLARSLDDDFDDPSVMDPIVIPRGCIKSITAIVRLGD